jgi:hypothetical protein
MAKQTFTTGQVLTAAQMTSLQANDYNWSVNAQTASYVLIAADAGKQVTMNNAGATTITVNTSLFTAGDTLRITNIGAGTCTITAGTATVSSAGALALVQYASGILYFSTASAAIFFPDAKTTTSKILQVQSVFKADAFSFTSTSYIDVTGLSVSITPTSATSTILCMGQLNTGTAASEYIFAQLLRGATAIGNGTGGSSYNAISSNNAQNASQMWTTPFTYIDSPATTSATTYKIQVRTSAGTAYVNRRAVDTAMGGSSSLIVMEVAA